MGNPNWPISRSVVSAPGRFLGCFGRFFPWKSGKPHRFQKWLDDVHSTLTRWFEVTFLGWLSDLLERLSDLQLGEGEGHFESPGTRKMVKLLKCNRTQKMVETPLDFQAFDATSENARNQMLGYMTSNDKGSSCVTAWITWTNYRFLGILPYFLGGIFGKGRNKVVPQKRWGNLNTWEFLQLQKDGGCLLSI